MKLSEEEARELVAVTNSQFAFWRQVVHRETNLGALQADARAKTKEKWKNPNYLYYWFILSHLRMQSAPFRKNKKDMFEVIDGVASNTTRRYVSEVQELGLVETITHRRSRILALTETGRFAVEETIDRWQEQFGEIYTRHSQRRT